MILHRCFLDFGRFLIDNNNNNDNKDNNENNNNNGTSDNNDNNDNNGKSSRIPSQENNPPPRSRARALLGTCHTVFDTQYFWTTGLNTT